jgi:CCR4-NOT transcription complex subunit 9
MMNSQHVYGHHQYSAQVEPTWVHQQNAHQHRVQQAAAAAASAAQQQHYNHIAAAHNTANALNVAHPQEEMTVSEDNRRTLSYVADLLNENTREAALLELSKKREQVPELALILWHSFGTSSALVLLFRLRGMMLTSISEGVMTSLLQEIISVYNLLNPSQLTAAASNRVCNALALLQCVASHNETRTLFLNGTYALILWPPTRANL